MRRSVIGIFEYRRDAIRARDAVQAMGVADVELNLMPANDLGPAGLTDEEFDRYQDAIDLLFDHGADDEAQLYVAALRQGSTLLTVSVDGGSLEPVKDALLREGATELADAAATATSGDQTVAEAAQDKAKGTD